MAFDEENGMDVAWNQVKVNGLPREEKQRLLSEVEILKELDHKNIIKLYHSWIVTEKDEISVNFITEACAQTLKKYAAKLKTNLDLRAVKSWSRQILRGLDYLHSHSPPIVHRDLKCDNIFVNQNQGEVKIGDLGLAAALENQRTKSVIGTPEFMAPELYDEDYDERVDIYSFGMCIIELVTHEVPYCECSNPAQIYKRVTGGVKPESLDKIIDADLRSFILKCISPIEKRLNAKELMNDPFLDRTTKAKVVEKVVQRATVEEDPEVERPGGTAQFVVAPEKKESLKDKAEKRDADDDEKKGSRSARESHAEGEVSGAQGGDTQASASDDGHTDPSGETEWKSISRTGSEIGDPSPASFAQAVGTGHNESSSRVGSDAGSESTSPTNAQTAQRTSGESPSAAADGDASGKEPFGNSTNSENPSPSGSRDELSSEARDAPGGLPRPKSRLGLSSRSASKDNLASMAEQSETKETSEKDGEPRRKGGSLDFRVKGRILEDKTLRLRLKIGDASGHTRTVEFPFNTDTDSSYSVASEMVDELQLAQSDIRTIMNEIENEVKFLNEGKKKMDEGGKDVGAKDVSSPGVSTAQTDKGTEKRSSAPDLAGYSSGDGEKGQGPAPNRPMTRSQSHHAAASIPSSGVASPPRASSPSLPTAQTVPMVDSAPPPAYPSQDAPAAIPPPPAPAVIEAAVEAVARAAAQQASGAESPAGTHSPPSAHPSAPVPSQWGPPAASAHPISHLEHQMAHVNVGHHPAPHQTHPPHHGHGQWQRGAPSSTASSVISEDLTYQPMDEEDLSEEREMEQLVALQQREASDMARRHNQQMAEKREAMTRRKLERKSLLGGAHGVGSASSMSSLGDGYQSAHSGGSGGTQQFTGTQSQARPIGASGTEGIAVGNVSQGGRPPVAKPPSHQTGPPPPGSTPPTSPAFHNAAARPSSHSTQNVPGLQPYGVQHTQMASGGSGLTPPQPPSRAPTPTQQQQQHHPTIVQQLSQSNANAAMSRSASNGSVGGGHASSGNNSDDGKPNEKAVKQAKAKEKLMMMEASALLNLDGFSKGSKGAGEKKETTSMKPKKDAQKTSAAAETSSAQTSGQTSGHTQATGVPNPQGSQQTAQTGPILGSEPADRCVKPTTYAPANTSVEAYNGEIPPSTGVAAPPMNAQQPPAPMHQVQLVQQSAAAAATAAQEAQRTAAAQQEARQQQAQQVQQHQQAQQAQMQQASNAFSQ